MVTHTDSSALMNGYSRLRRKNSIEPHVGAIDKWYDVEPEATAAAAGPGGGGEAPKDYTKPHQIIPSPKKIIQRHRILDKTKEYLTKT